MFVKINGYWVTTKQATDMLNYALVNTQIRRVVIFTRKSEEVNVDGVIYNLADYEYKECELDAMITSRYKGNIATWAKIIALHKEKKGYTTVSEWLNALSSNDKYRLSDEIEMFLRGDYKRDGNGW